MIVIRFEFVSEWIPSIPYPVWQTAANSERSRNRCSASRCCGGVSSLLSAVVLALPLSVQPGVPVICRNRAANGRAIR